MERPGILVLALGSVMRISLRRSLAVLCLASLGALHAGEPLHVEKRTDPVLMETHYGIRMAGCTITWITDTSTEQDPAFGIQEVSECWISPETQIPLRDALLQAIRKDTQGFKGIRGFQWGKLGRNDANGIYRQRFLKAVDRSPHWDKRRGRLVKYPKGLACFIREVLQRENVFAELVSSFASQGLELRPTDVERVQVLPVDADGLKGKFPVDCAILFTVTKK